ncbi:MAG TPA: membrane protein insertion efficiency factor YidD [Candidatus Binatia bacterium]|nr:membrane protein insertion efficiency factor YidD [Candidatus Binatia bacterium]
MNLAQFTLIAALRLYRAALSPVLTFVFGPLGFGCRFQPTCSNYALDAVRNHGACKGTVFALRRLCRCHPWGGSGYDPVPPAERGQPCPHEPPDAVLGGQERPRSVSPMSR